MAAYRLPLTVALPWYDHVYEVVSGAVPIAGADPTFVEVPVDVAADVSAGSAWDVADLAVTDYMARRGVGDDSATALPVFPARAFVHDSITVRTDRIATPGDLRGTRIAATSWGSAVCVHVRGLLTDHYGIRAEDATWVTSERPLVDLLRDGSVDAVIAPPRCLPPDEAALARLFERPGEADRAWFGKTRVFPILRVLVVRTELLHEHRWLASNLYRAFEVARRRYYARLEDIRASRVPIPSVAGHAADLRRLFGGEIAPYGLEPNRAALQTLRRHAAEQGVAPDDGPALDDLFAPVEPFVDGM